MIARRHKSESIASATLNLQSLRAAMSAITKLMTNSIVCGFTIIYITEYRTLREMKFRR